MTVSAEGLRLALVDLCIEHPVLPRVADSLANAERRRGEVLDRQAAAREGLRTAQGKFAAGKLDLDALGAAAAEAHVWADMAGTLGPAARAAHDALGSLQQRVDLMLLSVAGELYAALALRVAELVDDIATLPPLGRGIRTDATNFAGDLAAADRGGDYVTLAKASAVWGRAHQVADVLRTHCGYESHRYPAPLALCYRSWERVDMEQLHPHAGPYRLWYAVANGWEPGLWAPEDFTPGSRRLSFGERLARFAQAVGVN